MAPGPGEGPRLPANAQGMHEGANKHVLDRSGSIALTSVLQLLPGRLQSLLASTFTNELPWVPLPVLEMSTPPPFTPEQLAWLQGNFLIKPPPSTSADSASSSAGPTSVTGEASSEPASGECQGTMLGHRLNTVGLTRQAGSTPAALVPRSST